MVKRTSFESAECPIARSLDAIGDWWSLLIIRDALLGTRRFGEFQKSLGARQEHPDGAAARAGRRRHPEHGARLRRQRLSGICADAERPRGVSGAGGAAAMERGIRRPRRRDRNASWSIATRAGRCASSNCAPQDGRLLGAGDTELKPNPAAKRRRSASPALERCPGHGERSCGARPTPPSTDRSRALRQLALAAQPEVFLRFQFGHPQQMAEHLEPMAAAPAGPGRRRFPR